MAQLSATKKFICLLTETREEEATLLNRVGGCLFSKKWGCWTMTNSPRNAYKIIKEMKRFIRTCDPQVKADAIAYHEAVKTKYETKPPIPNLSVNGWEHQRKCFSFVSLLTGAMATMEMGCGKTLVALGLVENNQHRTILTACPKRVAQVWPPAIAEFCTSDIIICQPTIKSVENRVKAIEKELAKAQRKDVPFWLILNYEALWREPMATLLTRMHWDVIIYDEIHKIKAPNGVASKFCAKLVKNSDKRYGLTGTPLPHGPEDIFAQYRALDPSVFGTSFTTFKARYMEFGGFGGKQIQGYKNMEDYNERLESISFRVTAEVLNLPEAVDTNITCKLDDKTMEMYGKLEDELYLEIEQGEVTAANALVKLLKLQQLTAGFLKMDDGNIVQIDTAKIDTLCEFVENLPENEPFVVFCRFTQEIKTIRASLEEKKIETMEISGARDDYQAWKAGKGQGLVVNIQAGEAGLDFTRAAYVFYTSKGYDMGRVDQSRKRIDRPGQKRTPRYFHLIVPGTVDVKVETALAERKEIVSFVMDGIKLNPYGHRKCKPNESGVMTKEEAMAMFGLH